MLYEAIFHRKSVRKYKPDDIEPTLLEQLEHHILTIKPLIPDIQYEVKLLKKGQVSNNWAPRYVAIYSERKQGYLLNAGYLLQQVDLYVQSQGLGSCWIGLARPQEIKSKRYGYVIMISVGYPEVDVNRSIVDFKRKNINEITDLNLLDVMEAVRLAPSAVNSQPWYFAKNEDGLDIYRNKKGLYTFALSNWNQIDIGIAILHLELSLTHHHYSFERYKKFSVTKKPGFEYIMSLKWK